jgi:hypothetical protein
VVPDKLLCAEVEVHSGLGSCCWQMLGNGDAMSPSREGGECKRGSGGDEEKGKGAYT